MSPARRVERDERGIDRRACPSRCACWRPTARSPTATCRRSRATRCSTPGARCCARACATSAASRCSARGGWGPSRRSTARRRPSSARPGRSTPRATGSCPSTASCRRCCASATGWPRRCSTTRATRPAAAWTPSVNVLPFQISLAAQIPHAVGLAWGLRHQGRDAVVCHLLRRRRVVGGRRARGAEPRRRAPRAGRLRAQEQRLGDLHAGAQADRRDELRRPGGRLRHRRRAGRRQRPLRDARRLLARRSRGRGRGRGRR